jgi:hypothetical protein
VSFDLLFYSLLILFHQETEVIFARLLGMPADFLENRVKGSESGVNSHQSMPGVL